MAINGVSVNNANEEHINYDNLENRIASADYSKATNVLTFRDEEGTQKFNVEVEQDVLELDDTLSKTGFAADAKAVGDEIARVESSIPNIDSTLSTTGDAADAGATGALIVNAMNQVAEGFNDAIEDYYEAHTDGTMWVDSNNGVHVSAVTPDADEEIQTYVTDWLDDHPEATTTVVDGSITWGKLNATVQNKVAVTDSEPLYFAAVKLANKTGGRGDCNVFYGATNGIIDFGKDSNVTDLLAFLQAKNIEKIDWAIISHYHADHCTENFTTALSKLISGGIDFSECTFYLPHKNINWGSFSGNDVMSARETDVKSALASASIEYIEPTNDTVVEFNGVRITFLNIGDYTDYYAYTKNSKGEVTSDTTYNNFSMVAVLEYLNKAIVMTGDIYDLAQDKIIDAIKKCDIYKVEHHASNTMYSHDWYAKIACEYAVVDQYSSDGWHIEELLMSGVRRLYEQGTKVLFTGNQTQILKIDYTGITMDDCLPSILPNTKQLASDFIIDYGADLNDYWHVGTYGSLNQTANYGYTLSNCPTTKIFKMEVTNIRGADWGDTLSRRQRIITVDGEEFVRRLNVNRNTLAVTAYAWMPLHATVQTGVAVLANNGAVEDTSTLRITRAGHVVTVRVDAKLLSTAGTGWRTVYSGLPGAANIVIFNAVTPNGNVFRANISADGNLQIANTAETNDRVDTTFMYITKNDV